MSSNNVSRSIISNQRKAKAYTFFTPQLVESPILAGMKRYCIEM